MPAALSSIDIQMQQNTYTSNTNTKNSRMPVQQVRRTRIKVCGMTRVEDVQHAVSQGVDAIGMILYANSPRTISLDQAALIRKAVPAFVNLVGVFVDAEHKFIEQAIDHAGIDLIQLHGDESEECGLALSRPYIKAIRAKSAEQVAHDCRLFPSAKAILLDPYVAGQHGGTGQELSIDLWPRALPSNSQAQSLILAGGLSPTNVADRISALAPYAVDMNSGLELSPGVKDKALLERAIMEVRRADSIGD